MKYAIKAVYLPQTATKPNRFKFTNAQNTKKVEICVNGDRWNMAETEAGDNAKQIDIVNILAKEYAKSVLFWNYKEYVTAMSKQYSKPEYVTIPLDENCLN